MTLHSAKGLEFDSVFLGWLGGRAVPAPKKPRRRGLGRSGGRAPPRLCRHYPRQVTRQDHLCPEPAHPWAVATGNTLALHRRASRGSYRSRRACQPVWRLRESAALTMKALSLTGDYGTPGWQRARQNVKRAPADPRRISPDHRRRSGRIRNLCGFRLPVGERIFHDKFGYGAIARIDGNKLTVDFDKAGQKKVVDSFVTRH